MCHRQDCNHWNQWGLDSRNRGGATRKRDAKWEAFLFLNPADDRKSRTVAAWAKPGRFRGLRLQDPVRSGQRLLYRARQDSKWRRSLDLSTLSRDRPRKRVAPSCNNVPVAT